MKKVTGIILIFIIFIFSNFSFAAKSPYHPWEKTFTGEFPGEEAFVRLLEDTGEDEESSCQIIVRKDGDIEIFIDFNVEDGNLILKNEYYVNISSKGEIKKESSSLEEQRPELREGLNKCSREIIKEECINDIEKLPLKVKKKIKKAFNAK